MTDTGMRMLVCRPGALENPALPRLTAAACRLALSRVWPAQRPTVPAGAGLGDQSVTELATDTQVIEAIDEAVERANGDLAAVEQIKRFRVLPTEWQPGGEELTPTMKLKRRTIAERYATEIDQLYAAARA